MKKFGLSIIIFILGLSLACLPTLGSVATPTQVTQTPYVITATELPTIAPPQDTPTAVVPPASPTPVPSVTAAIVAITISNANCRYGPNGNFNLIEVIPMGTSVNVIGQNNDSSLWWQLQLGDGKICWVKGDYLTVSGSTSSIPKVASPPIPATINPWVGTWTMWQNQCTSNVQGCENVFSMEWDTSNPSTISGSYTTGGCTYYDVLTLSEGGMRADGTETGCGATFEVHLVMDPKLNQFRGRWTVVGNTSIDGYYCGAKNGAPKPNPTRP